MDNSCNNHDKGRKDAQGRKPYDYLIVGAGLFGSVFAREATDAGCRCLVIDRREHTGGNIRCESIDGINVHKYGAHIFHTDDIEVWNYVNRFADFNHFVNSPMANFRGKLYSLPFTMYTFYQLWGVRTPQEAAKMLEKQCAEHAHIEHPANFEEQALKLCGRDIYETLIKGYTEKQWGRPARELPADIINRVPMRLTFNNNYFNDPLQGIPKGGYNTLINALLDGIEVRLDTDYFDSRAEFDGMVATVIFTGQIDRYFDYRLGRLEYRSLRFETEWLDMPDFQGNAVINYTASEVPYTRIIEHKHFEYGSQPSTVITYEYPQQWKDGLEPYYPINNERNNALVAEYRELARRQGNVVFGGRLGQYAYFDMDDTVAAALKLADELLSAKSTDK